MHLNGCGNSRGHNFAVLLGGHRARSLCDGRPLSRVFACWGFSSFGLNDLVRGFKHLLVQIIRWDDSE